MKKPNCESYQTENGMWKIRDIKDGLVWCDEFDTQEEADTYALRNGAIPKGC